MTVAALVQALASGDVRGWSGLPPLNRSDLIAALGSPTRSDQGVLGYYPATLERYRVLAEPLLVWIRNNAVVMIELAGQWPLSMLESLGNPCAILPQEVFVEGSYCHEYLYCGHGLVATVAESLKRRTKCVIRLRGFQSIQDPSEFGPEYYKPLDDQIQWSVK